MNLTYSINDININVYSARYYYRREKRGTTDRKSNNNNNNMTISTNENFSQALSQLDYPFYIYVCTVYTQQMK